MANEDNDWAQFDWLVLCCQTGDMEAFADLIAVTEKPLLYYAASLTGNQDGAIDVMRDVWIKVVRGIRRLKEAGSLKPWLYAITHGVAVDCIRRDYKRDKAEQTQLSDPSICAVIEHVNAACARSLFGFIKGSIRFTITASLAHKLTHLRCFATGAW